MAAKNPELLKTIKDIRDAVMEMAGEDTTNTCIQSRVDLFINERYRNILEANKSEFTYVDTQLVLSVKENTGTVDYTQGSATITGTGTAFSATDHIGQKFKALAFDEIYRISDVASTTSLTLGAAYQGATATSSDYKILTDSYDLPDDFDELVVCWSDQLFSEVEIITLREMKELQREQAEAEGIPRKVTIDYESGQQRPRLVVWPVPDDAQTIHVTYQRRIPGMVSDATYLKDDQDLDGSTVTTFDNTGSLDKITFLTFQGSSASATGNVTIVGKDWLNKPLTETIALNGTSVTRTTKKFKTITSVAVPTVASTTVDIGIEDPPALPPKSSYVLFWGALADAYEMQGDDNGRAWAEGKYQENLRALFTRPDPTKQKLKFHVRENRKRRRLTPATADLGSLFDRT